MTFSIKHILTLILCVGSIFAVHAQDLSSVTLKNGQMEMTAINYGARIKTLKVGGVDVVLGFDTDQRYTNVKQNFGAVVGRYIGRILGGHLSIDGTDYKLQTAANGDTSHGGSPSFSQRYWTITNQDKHSVTMRYVSPDGENGFPGELTLDVTYTLTDDALRIDYVATTTKPTVLNPSNHTFFNLSGYLNHDVLDQTLWIDSKKFATYDENKRVTGTLQAVKDTPFDFNKPTLIGSHIDDDDPQLEVTKGYDHCYQLNNKGDIGKAVASLSDPTSGITMRVFTTEPAMQIYTANSHDGSMLGKQGKSYPKRNAICFETMHFPDSPNKPQWPSTLLRPGETFNSTTIFQFSSNRERGEVPVSNGGTIYYESEGQGTPVILLHGHTLDLRMWNPQMEALTKSYRVIRPEFRGYGHSSRQSEDMNFTHTDDILALMDYLHIDRAHIVGLSMGSFVASELLALHPDRFITATLASGNIRKRPGPSTPFTAEEIKEQDSTIMANKTVGIDLWKKDWIDKLVANGGSNSESIRQPLTQQINDWDGWLLFHHEGRIYYGDEAWEALKNTRPEVPTLILSGEHEHKSPKNAMMPYLPNSKLVVIPDCGHISNMEKPEEFNKLLLEHFKQAK